MSETALQNVFLGRQPILDRTQQLFAYELLFRSGDAQSGNFASFLDGNEATARVIANAFAEFSMADALGPYQGMIKVDAGLLLSDLVDALAPRLVILEILESAAPSEALLTRCAQLKADGYRFALRERPESLDHARPLMTLAEIVKIDISRIEPERLRQMASALKAQGKTLLAEKVETVEQMELCSDLGFDLFQGYFFARPTVIQGKRMHTSELSLLRLIALLSQDADSSEVEKVFKQEPVLTVNLLRLTNSAGGGMPTKITSLRHAITLLGRRQLLRWLQLLLYSATSSESQGVSPLLVLAATRGRLMELLIDGLEEGKSGGRDIVDQAHMVGILSLMPALAGTSMADVLNQLPLAPPVHDALGSHSGTLGELLTLVESLENDDASATAQALEKLPAIDATLANACLARALTWANNLGRNAE